LALAGFAFVLTTMPSPADAQESTWDRLKRTNTLQTGCILHPPYWSKDQKSGEWKGWAIEGGKALRKDLEVVGVKKWECSMTTWGTAALGIQSGKLDYLFAMQATPIRATAITFAGPLYNHGFMVIANKNFKAPTGTWADFNKPDVKLAVIGGTSTALVRRFVAPKATAVELPKAAEVPLAVIAGRADGMITTVMPGVYAKARNPDMGDFIIPQPLFSFPAYVGIANEPDRRFRDFMHWWAEWQRLRGQVEKWIREAMLEQGVAPEDIPDKLYF
jgi:polar amino acid transport system substrate-binding protein